MTTSPELTFFDDVVVTYIDKLGSDDTVISAARVSTRGANGASLDRDTRINNRCWAEHFQTHEEALAFSDVVREEEYARDKGLINMLMRDRHGSPFEHISLQLYVKAPLFVFREWQRHRIASYNEMSGRYTVLSPEFYVPAEDRPLVQVGKPGAYSFEPGTPEQYKATTKELKLSSIAQWNTYQKLLESGLAKELARAVLPLNIYSQMYVTMNARSLMNFLSLRTKTKPHSAVPSFPQHEISLGADKVEELFAEHFPWTYEAWNNNGRVAP